MRKITRSTYENKQCQAKVEIESATKQAILFKIKQPTVCNWSSTNQLTRKCILQLLKGYQISFFWKPLQKHPASPDKSILVDQKTENFKGKCNKDWTLYLWFPKRSQNISDKSKESKLIPSLHWFQDGRAVRIK